MWEQEQLPYDAGTMQLRLTGNNTAELQDMYEALSQRAREITSEIISLDAPESEYPGAALRLAYQQQRALLWYFHALCSICDPLCVRAAMLAALI